MPPSKPRRMTAVGRYIDHLRASLALRGTDIATFADMLSATVHRWKAASHAPGPDTQLLVARLRYVVSRLAEYYTPDEVRGWLCMPHPQLEGRRAIDAIVGDGTVAVIAMLERLDSDAFV